MAIVGSKTIVGGALDTDDVRMTFAGINLGLIVEQAQYQFKQNLNRIWDLQNSAKTYYITGRSQGQVSIAGVSGPGGMVKGFLTKFGDVCNAAGNVISFSYDANWCAGATLPSNGGTTTFHGVVMDSVGGTVQTQDMVYRETVSGIFTRLG